jgi:hypothetical protein
MQKKTENEFTEISLSLFDNECEISSYKKGSGHILLFTLDRAINGYITIDGIVTTVRDGSGRFDSRLLSRGDYTPTLISDGVMIKLPKIRRGDSGVTLSPPEDSYIRALSMRERALEEKVRGLESLVLGLQDKVFGKTIF